MNAVEKAKKVREEHKRAMLILATTVVVLGGVLGVTGYHGHGMFVEAVGLYLVAII